MTQGPNSTTPALVAQRFVEAFNARDEQRLRKLYHPEEFQFDGNNTQPLTLFNGQEIPATGRPLRLHGTIVLDVDEQGLIRGERQYWEVYPLVEFWMTVGVIGS
jgi:hypothetical protein